MYQQVEHSTQRRNITNLYIYVLQRRNLLHAHKTQIYSVNGMENAAVGYTEQPLGLSGPFAQLCAICVWRLLRNIQYSRDCLLEEYAPSVDSTRKADRTQELATSTNKSLYQS
jgi:hypothetical protein